MHLTIEQWERELGQIRVLWRHCGDLKRPFVRFTSGKRADAYLNSQIISNHRMLFHYLCDDLAEMIQTYLDAHPEMRPDMICAPESSAPVFAREIGKRLGIPVCSVTKDGVVLMPPHMTSIAGLRVLVFDDAFTTGGSVHRAITALKDRANATVVDFIPVIVSWSPERFFEGKEILPLLRLTCRIWDEGHCPYTSDGSEPLEPISSPKQRWGQLFA